MTGIIDSSRLRTAIFLVTIIFLGLAADARADVSMANGNFESSGTDFSTGGFAQGIPGWGEWNNNSGFPEFSDFLIIGAAHGAYLDGQTAGIGRRVPYSYTPGYLYQEIGTSGGKPRIHVDGLNFWRNDLSNQHGPLDVSLYWLPAGHGFSFAEVGNDIAGVGTLVSTFTAADPAGVNATTPFSFDYNVSSLASNARLFLRLRPGIDNRFAFVDNLSASAVPEPTGLALLGFGSVAGLLVWRIRKSAIQKRSIK